MIFNASQHFTALSHLFPNGTFAAINDVVRATVYEFITQNAMEW